MSEVAANAMIVYQPMIVSSEGVNRLTRTRLHRTRVHHSIDVPTGEHAGMNGAENLLQTIDLLLGVEVVVLRFLSVRIHF